MSALLLALACGVCLEDKVAATYDHALVERALRAGRVVVFAEPRKPVYPARLRAMAAAASRSPGVDAATVKTSESPASVSFVLDPRRASAHRTIASLKLDLLKVIDAPQSPVSRIAVWELGFRPFYLLGSAFAALSIAAWAAQYAGWLPAAYLRGATWHAHEMLFGYTMAIVAGFLFTAVRNWTGRPTPSGALLAGFALLWVAGRVLVLTPFALAAAVVNAAFPVAVAAAIAVPLVASGNRRNYFFVALLAGCGVAALCVHLALMGKIEWPARASLAAGLDVVLFIVAVVAGRVVPMFTNNAIPGAGAGRTPWAERLSLGAILALLAADLAGMDAAAAAVAGVGAMGHAWRLALWRPAKTLRTPLVWILHVSYAWIVVHLALRALSAVVPVPGTLAMHALTIGVIGGMTLGMMTRTARGHTGRLLVAGRAEMACYVLVQLAALVRVAGGWILPQWYLATVIAAAVCWSAAFAIYAVRYLPILWLPRVDGKPG